MKDDLNRAESSKRLKAQNIYRKLIPISIYYPEFKRIYDDYIRVQSNQPRSLYLTIGFGVISGVNTLKSTFPNVLFIEHLSIILSITSFCLFAFLLYRYFSFKPEKSMMLEELNEVFKRHEKEEFYIHEIPSPPHTSQPLVPEEVE